MASIGFTHEDDVKVKAIQSNMLDHSLEMQMSRPPLYSMALIEIRQIQTCMQYTSTRMPMILL